MLSGERRSGGVYSLARGLAAAVTGESGEAAAYCLAREGRRRQSVGPGAPERKLRNRC